MKAIAQLLIRSYRRSVRKFQMNLYYSAHTFVRNLHSNRRHYLHQNNFAERSITSHAKP
jgi:hypothetical protein